MQDRSLEQPEDQCSPRVCYCMHVHEATIRRAIRAGATDLAALSAATRAGTGCGTCRFDLIEILSEELGPDASEESA